ncbi:hypothetical protein MUN77_07585 [Leucobacter allii]|uniref:hypothetical protein n=1 Tax=Leucobacter allii TaxID=2932247 RepID=UPI001FD01232|nr:hypothetical protein [Leucobacter allii]UOR03137.1 hypothetical protein MUN77_07585 [Leucobacter allii]
MSSNDSLQALCRLLLADPKLTSQPGWSRLALIFRVSSDHFSAEGFSFDSDQRSRPISPSPGSGVEDAFRRLQKAMRAEHPQDRAWLSCLLQISIDGRAALAVEYVVDGRWRWNPRDPRALARELAEGNPFAAEPSAAERGASPPRRAS